MHRVEVVKVFTSASGGGNPAPIVIDAQGLDEAAMTAIAKSHGHESGFVFAPESTPEGGADADFRFRFFVPRHEMSMCGHATIGAVWLLHRHGRIGNDTRIGPVTVQTLSGKVTAHLRAEADGAQFIEISQPAGTVQPIPRPELREDIIRAIGLEPEDILDLPFLNACTSRIKTLIPVRSPARLDAARPDSARIEQLCEEIDSTGLYLFSPDSAVPRKFDARQFPKSSGYPEDAATGIAAAALAFGLLEYGMVALDGQGLLVHQGRAMGCPSDIHVRFDLAPGSSAAAGCFVGGRVVLAA
ncbi:PhzF family phenazine biosynthesis protein [Undibacterium sp.]|uniref:PhzF family phenazine biosynthesis protein n=1 Tax=Undibacterium sp. TaxID=1914977 RepID=UPI00374C91D2